MPSFPAFSGAYLLTHTPRERERERDLTDPTAIEIDGLTLGVSEILLINYYQHIHTINPLC
jgi:hypothetical protein